jgi:hypothetical protein
MLRLVFLFLLCVTVGAVSNLIAQSRIKIIMQLSKTVNIGQDCDHNVQTKFIIQ